MWTNEKLNFTVSIEVKTEKNYLVDIYFERAAIHLSYSSTVKVDKKQ